MYYNATCTIVPKHTYGFTRNTWKYVSGDFYFFFVKPLSSHICVGYNNI